MGLQAEQEATPRRVEEAAVVLLEDEVLQEAWELVLQAGLQFQSRIDMASPGWHLYQHLPDCAISASQLQKDHLIEQQEHHPLHPTQTRLRYCFAIGWPPEAEELEARGHLEVSWWEPEARRQSVVQQSHLQSSQSEALIDHL